MKLFTVIRLVDGEQVKIVVAAANAAAAGRLADQQAADRRKVA